MLLRDETAVVLFEGAAFVIRIPNKEPTECALEMSIIIFAKDKDAAIEKWNRRVGDG